jgi:hypothetical protein
VKQKNKHVNSTDLAAGVLKAFIISVFQILVNNENCKNLRSIGSGLLCENIRCSYGRMRWRRRKESKSIAAKK